MAYRRGMDLSPFRVESRSSVFGYGRGGPVGDGPVGITCENRQLHSASYSSPGTVGVWASGPVRGALCRTYRLPLSPLPLPDHAPRSLTTLPAPRPRSPLRPHRAAETPHAEAAPLRACDWNPASLGGPPALPAAQCTPPRPAAFLSLSADQRPMATSRPPPADGYKPPAGIAAYILQEEVAILT